MEARYPHRLMYHPEFAEHVARCSYLPGWTFTVDPPLCPPVMAQAARVRASFTVTDSNPPHRPIPLTIAATYSLDVEPVEAVRRLVAWFANHEIDEWLRVDSERAAEPH